MVQVRGSEHDARHAQGCGWIDAGKARLHESQLSRGRQAADRPALAVTPAGLLLVPPYTVTKVLYRAPVRAPAVLATALGALEADQRGQFAPVDRVEPAMFTRDRHGEAMSQTGQERKEKTLLPIGPAGSRVDLAIIAISLLYSKAIKENPEGGSLSPTGAGYTLTPVPVISPHQVDQPAQRNSLDTGIKPIGKPMSRAIAQANAAKSSIRAHVEHVSAHQKNRFGLFIRTIGLVRAEAKLTLCNLAYNFNCLIFHEGRECRG